MDSADDPIDLLLLNCSNLPFIPLFPYAFVQLRALAGRRGIKTEAFDLVCRPEEQSRETIRDLIDRYRPRAIGFTVRQLDSIIADQYLPGAHAGDRTPPPSSLNLFPLEATRDAILEVRSVTDAPVLVGGVGFSTSPLEIARYLGVDLGVRGEPDAFLDSFDAVLRGEALASTPNLIYRSGEGFVGSPRCFFDPFDGTEYDDAIIGDLEGFYGKENLYSSGPPAAVPFPSTRPSIPVEISRGCPFHCGFCVEPRTNGAEVRRRRLDAIAEDIRFLASRGLRYLWLVCSELNPGSSEFSLLVAEEITRINEQLADNPIVWRSYHLPRWFSEGDLRLLYRSGFLGGRNDFPAWEDENLAANRVPYRTEHILGYLRDLRTLEMEGDLETEGCSLFFGNPHADARSISRTLRLYDDHGFAEYYGRFGFGLRATRIFGCCFDHLPVARGEITTVTREGTTPTDLIHPSFHVPRRLVDALGGIGQAFEFFEFLPNVVRSRRALAERDWVDFLGRTSDPERLSSLLQEVGEPCSRSEPLSPADADSRVAERLREICQDPSISALKDVFAPPPDEGELLNDVASVLLQSIYSHHCGRLEGVLEFLQLPSKPGGLGSLSTYRLMEKLYAQYSSTEDLLRTVQSHFRLEDDSSEMFLLHYLLFLYQVEIKPEWRELLFGPTAA